jgi:Fic-DOC domain mobile mystery protein B
MWRSEVDGTTPLDPDEAAGLLLPHVQTRGELNQLEQANIQEAILWFGAQRTFQDLLRREFVCALHKRMFGQVWRWAGQLRTTEKNIGIEPLHIEMQLRQLLDNAGYWAENRTYLPTEFAARLHHRLVQIHLFPNGNGRHARLYTDVILERVLRQPRPTWAGNRDDYIAALRSADGGDYAPLIEWLG